MNLLRTDRIRHADPAPSGDRWLFCGLLALLVWLPLPNGSHVAWASHLFSALALSLLTLWCALAALGRISGPPKRLDLLVPLLIWFLWLGWIMAQILPLSTELLSQISPNSARIHRSVSALPAVQSLNTLSIAPGKTLLALELSLGYFALYVLILVMVKDESRTRQMLIILAISGAVQGAYGSFMTLSGEEWGFFTHKTAYVGYATGTFVNRNHLAGYLEMTAAMGLALILADLGRGAKGKGLRHAVRGLVELFFSTKFRIRALLVVMAIGLVLTRSRMGNTAFFLSLTAAGLGYIALRERRYFWRAFLLFGSLLLVDVAVVSNWFGLQKVVERVQQTGSDESTQVRLTFLEEAPPLIETYVWTGSGLGTFADAYAPFQTVKMRYYLDHAHNDYAEFLIETGIIGCALLALLVGAHILHCLRVIDKRRRRLPVAVCFGGLMALLALALHSTVDFNLQIPANAATLCVILALCASMSAKSYPTNRDLRHNPEERQNSLPP